MLFRKIIKRILYPNKYNSSAFTRYLKKRGCIVGEGTYFFAPKTTKIDVANACFITIGKYCKITSGVRILAHDYSYSVLRRVYHDIPKKAALTTIGDNVFIGVDSIILNGSEIGDNVIIGAGSVVSGKIPSNEVWGGNPAKFICTLKDYYNKCKSKFENSAELTVLQYQRRFNRNPSIQELQWFSTLFLDNGQSEYEKMSFNGDNKQEVIKDALSKHKKYNTYEEFIEHVNRKD